MIKRIIFSILPGLILLLVAELILIGVNFRYSHTPLEMKEIEHNKEGIINTFIYNANRKGTIELKKDSRLFWVRVNGPIDDVSLEKRSNQKRIATLGCSCTTMCVGGELTYPLAMQNLLDQRNPNQIEVLNFGVGGYTTLQGLRLLEERVVKYKPDIVTVYFGWNDHWVSGVEDKNIIIQPQWVISSFNLLEKFRTFQMVNYLLSKVKEKSKEPTLQFRVSPQDYKNNLNKMVDVAEQNNIKLLLITAPHDLSDFSGNVSFFPFDNAKAIKTHKLYNSIVREVALNRKVALLDLEMIQHQNKDTDMISEDGIHLSTKGCEVVAKYIVFALDKYHLM